jgi:hypothetical protein
MSFACWGCRLTSSPFGSQPTDRNLLGRCVSSPCLGQGSCLCMYLPQSWRVSSASLCTVECIMQPWTWRAAKAHRNGFRPVVRAFWWPPQPSWLVSTLIISPAWSGLDFPIISSILCKAGGRGGRDGSPCVVRPLLGPSLPNLHYEKATDADRATVDQFVQQGVRNPKCRRRVLAQYFDGDTKRMACRTQEAPCDVYEHHGHATLIPSSTTPRACVMSCN